MKDENTNLPIDVNSPFISFLQSTILWSVKVLAFFMVIILLWSVADVILLILIKAHESSFLIMDIDEVLTIFGAFLIVLIAIEIFLNIILYLKKDMSHLKLVVATALMAIARKVIILDYDQVQSSHMIGMGVVILSLGMSYWLIVHAHQTSVSPVTSPKNETPST